MTEEEYFAAHNGDGINKLLRSYHRAFRKGYFDIEATGVRLSEEELRADLLHCLYHNKPKDMIDSPDKRLIELIGIRGSGI
ncbi:hypothetical protein [Bifidobacterium vansinderenii]|uniref:Uncharacterized protein n=1 Tax=Bifidobacterium vansinderenii TaxID=1984871 RepID=A0A229W167_9BIFI|nr:hypothetical protein [Bifidobacterium vansinderenii]OXN01598.1 hypothetical protein Tam10B_0041 [Bifidobacterium vansinderenii]